MSDAGYRLWVNQDSTVLVRMWLDVGDGREIVEVAVRDDPGHIWGPPTILTEERVR